MSAAGAARRIRLRAGGAGVVASTLRATPEESAELRAGVAALLADTRARGDDALVEQAVRFGSPGFTRDRLRVGAASLQNALTGIPAELRTALGVAAAQVRALAEAQRPEERAVTLEHGQRIRMRTVPVDSVGCYVPGGRAAYPSSLVMAAVPAQVAGVPRIAVASPPGPDGQVPEVIRATAALLGIDEVYAVGGAGAICALAYGTATISPVAVITGPGNAWVTEAKRQVIGTVGIDSLAGPSELLVIADDDAEAEIVAADLLAQAEHGPDSLSVLAATGPSLCDRVSAILDARGDLAPGAVVLVDCMSLPLAVELAEALAPEHLQLMLSPEEAERIASAVTRAGCVFLGRNGGTAFGDYVAGSNHILPTGGAARFASAVGPATFMRRMSVVDLPQGAVAALVPHLAAIADAEGFPEHRRSAELRIAAGGAR